MRASASVVALSLAMVAGFAGTGRATSVAAAPAGISTMSRVHYREVDVDGVSIFFREAGRADAPTLLLLHGFPSSSRMFEPLLSRLADSYHLIAPDYPGFGHSGAPDAKAFEYTFDHIAKITVCREARHQPLCPLHAGLWRPGRISPCAGASGTRPGAHHPER